MTKLNRPYVICHMMQTLDGKIASGMDGVEIIMDYFDLYTSTEKKLESKAWMFGRKTGAAFAEDEGTPLPESSQVAHYYDFIAQDDETFAVVIDTQGVLRWSENFISLSNQDKEFHLIIIVTKQTPNNYLQYLKQKRISYIFAGDTKADLTTAAKTLKKSFNIEKILLEGGGSFNGSMMVEGLVDEISLLLLPRVLNKKDAPSLFDSQTSKINLTNYKLASSTQLDGGVLWLRYTRF